MQAIISILIFFGVSECANILGIFPTPSFSHQIVYHALAKDLAARGHHLTILTTDLVNYENSNVTQIDLHSSYELYRERFSYVELKEKKLNEINVIKKFYDVQVDLIDDQLSHPKVKSLIKDSSNHRFDVVIFEHIHYSTFLAFAELYDCPAIGIISFDTFNSVHELHGNEVNPVLHPEFLFPYEHGKLSFSERWNSLKYYLTMKLFTEPMHKKRLRVLVEKHFPTVKSSMQELQDRIGVLMTNTSPGKQNPFTPFTYSLFTLFTIK